MAHEGSVHNSERRAIEAAEARGYAAGWSDRAAIDIEFCDRHGHGAAANDLRHARLVDRDAGNVVDLINREIGAAAAADDRNQENG